MHERSRCWSSGRAPTEKCESAGDKGERLRLRRSRSRCWPFRRTGACWALGRAGLSRYNVAGPPPPPCPWPSLIAWLPRDLAVVPPGLSVLPISARAGGGLRVAPAGSLRVEGFVIRLQP